MRIVRFAIVFVALTSLPSGISAIEQNPTRDPVDYRCKECIRGFGDFAECGDDEAPWGAHSSWSGCQQNVRVCYSMPGLPPQCEPECGSRCLSI